MCLAKWGFNNWFGKKYINPKMGYNNPFEI